MTGNYYSREGFAETMKVLIEGLTFGDIDPYNVRGFKADPDKVVFEVFHLDRDGAKILLGSGEDSYTPTYYYTVTPVDATISW